MKKLTKENLASLKEWARNIWCAAEKNRHDVCTLLIVGYFVLYIAPDYMGRINATICNALCLVFAVIAFFLQWDRKFTSVAINEVCFYALVWVLHISAIAYNRNISLTSMIHILKHFFLAAALVRTTLNLKLVKRCYWIIFQFFAAFMLVGIDPGSVPHSVSQNAIGVHIFLFATLVLLAEANKKSLQLKSVFLTAAIICVWIGSRTSLIAIGTVIFGLFFQHLPEVSVKDFLKRITRKAWVVIGIAVALLVAAIVILSVAEFPEGSYLYLLTRDRAPIWGNARFVMMGDFFKNVFVSFGNFLFGPNFHSVPTIDYWGGNPHNAFIHAYGNYGVFFFLLVPCLILQAVIRLWKESKAMCFLLLGLTLRGMGDIVAFPGVYDGLIYFLIFEYFLFKDEEKTTENTADNAISLVINILKRIAKKLGFK